MGENTKIELCAGTFWSIEPLIEDLGDISSQLRHVQQVIIGGESGPHARPCAVDWIRSIARQCEAAGVPCFVKQLGSVPLMRQDSVDGRRSGDHPEHEWPEGTRFGTHPQFNTNELRGRHVFLRDKKGGDPSEWPEDLRQYRKLAWKGGA